MSLSLNCLLELVWKMPDLAIAIRKTLQSSDQEQLLMFFDGRELVYQMRLNIKLGDSCSGHLLRPRSVELEPVLP